MTFQKLVEEVKIVFLKTVLRVRGYFKIPSNLSQRYFKNKCPTDKSSWKEHNV